MNRHVLLSFYKTNNEAAVKKNKNSKCRNMEDTKEKYILLSKAVHLKKLDYVNLTHQVNTNHAER
jgi:hypothetical protein